jgi:chromate reductase
VTVINMADFRMPVYEQDLEAEQGMPENARAFKKLLTEHDAFLIASPEYNSAFRPMLVNALDWASRAEAADEVPLIAYQAKYCAVMSASPGGLGGMRGLVFLRMFLRMFLGNLGLTVLPEHQALGSAFKAFDADGGLIDKKQEQAIMHLGGKLAKTLALLQA